MKIYYIYAIRQLDYNNINTITFKFTEHSDVLEVVSVLLKDKSVLNINIELELI